MITGCSLPVASGVALDQLFLSSNSDPNEGERLCNPPHSVELGGKCFPSCGGQQGNACGAGACAGKSLLESYDCDVCCKTSLTPEFGSDEPNSGNERSHRLIVGPTSSGANALTGLGWLAPRYAQHSRTVGIVSALYVSAPISDANACKSDRLVEQYPLTIT